MVRIAGMDMKGLKKLMSDDLISRKAAVELVIAEYDRFQANGGSHSGRYELDKVIKMLQNMPTAFDKERVIKELEYDKEISQKYSTGLKEQGHIEAFDEAISIIKKGGIK